MAETSPPKSKVVFYSGLPDTEVDTNITPEDGAFGFRRKVAPAMPIDEKTLVEGIRELAPIISRVGGQDTELAFGLDEVEVTVQVTQKGEFRVWLATLGGEIEGGLKLVWRRRKQ